MNLFQYVSIAALGCLLAVEIARAVRGRGGLRARVVRCAVWATAAAAIACPDLTTLAAHTLGIQRGADLVSYLSVLAFLGAAFYGYACYARLENRVVVLARELAILTARQNPQKENADAAPAREAAP